MCSRSERDQLERHLTPVYRFALRLTAGDVHTAEDLAQEAMVRAWKHREKLRDESIARVWLLRITANAWRDLLRRRRTIRSWRDRVAGQIRSGPAPPDQQARQREDVAEVLGELDTLPERQREVLYLRACEGLAAPDIAEVLGMSVGAVRSNLSLARQQMRARMPVVEEASP